MPDRARRRRRRAARREARRRDRQLGRPRQRGVRDRDRGDRSEARVEVVGAARRLVRDASSTAPTTRCRACAARSSSIRSNRAAYVALAEAYRKQQKWADLADTLRAHAEIETDDRRRKVDLLIGLGDLYETQLASTAQGDRGVPGRRRSRRRHSDDALAALERLYRRDEQWANLAKVLDRRAEISEDAGDTGRAAAIRRELATLRAEKLGDLEGAIARYEAAVAANGSDADGAQGARRSLRQDRPHRGLPAHDGAARPGRARGREARDAAQARRRARGSRSDARARGVREAARRRPERRRRATAASSACSKAESNWYELVARCARHIAAAKTPAQRVELYLEAAQVYERELDDPHKAIEALLNVLAIDDDEQDRARACCRGSTCAPRQYDRAVDMLVRHARARGRQGRARCTPRPARSRSRTCCDPEVAQRHLEKALALDAENLARAQARSAQLHEKRGNWQQAVEMLLRAEAASGSRSERIALLWDAGAARRASASRIRRARSSSTSAC